MECQRVGQEAEDAAVAFLQACGVTILTRNLRYRLGELDIVARTATTLLIVEVRLRSGGRFGGAAASVNARKRVRIRRPTARLLQSRRELAALPVRFDVIAIDRDSPGNPIEWIQHAFT